VGDIYPAIPGLSSAEFEAAALSAAHGRRLYEDHETKKHARQRERNRVLREVRTA
jgi:hypothetical protein